MVNSFSQGKGRLVEPPYGSYVDSWQLPVNSNFGLTDALISGTTTLNTSTLTPAVPSWTLVFQDFDTNATPWLAARAGQNLRILVTGALSYDATILIPQNYAGLWIVDNRTTGAFTITVKTTAPTSTGVTVAQSLSLIVFCDGTNVFNADTANITPPVTVPVATSTVPGIVTQGLLAGNCVNLNAQAKIPFQTDKIIISTSTPVAAQGDQNWVWYQVV